MKNYQAKVKKFQERGKEKLYLGIVTDIRRTLLKEEINEFKESLKSSDRVEMLDGLLDILYVNSGTANYLEAILDPLKSSFIYNPNIHLGTNAMTQKLENIEAEYVEAINELTLFIAQSVGFTYEVIKEGLKRVHESNMSKFCSSIEECEITVESYRNQGVDAYYKDFVIYRKSDDKILKSINYNRVNLEDLI